MTLDPMVWEQIRAGRAPDAEVVERMARSELAVLGSAGAADAGARLSAAVLGAGPLERLMEDPAITDIAVNGDGRVWVDRGAGMEQVAVSLGSVAVRRAMAVRLVALAGRRLDDTAAYVDAVLPTGVRLHAILPPLVSGGPHVTLRVPARVPLSFEDLVAAGSVPVGWGPVLRGLVERRVSFLVSGGTGAGKTTLLGALLGLADQRERILVVEDVRELTVEHPHVVHLEGRSPNVEGVGEVTMVTLLRQALRMRPDRIVVGEVRGAEVRELLSALNTGHEGGAGTIHANAASDVVARIEALGALAGMSLPAVHAQVLSALAVVVQVRRHGRERTVESIGVVLGDPGGRPRVVPVLHRVRHEGGNLAGSEGSEGSGGGGSGGSAEGDPAGWLALRRAARERLVALVGAEVVP